MPKLQQNRHPGSRGSSRRRLSLLFVGAMFAPTLAGCGDDPVVQADEASPPSASTSEASATTAAPADESPTTTASPATTAAAPTTTVAASPSEPATVSTGSLRSLDYTVSGGVTVTRAGDASTISLIDLRSEDGPALALYVSTEAGVVSPDGATRVDSLQGLTGDQTYDLPAGIDSTEVRSVLIWCEQVNGPFGGADLQPK